MKFESPEAQLLFLSAMYVEKNIGILNKTYEANKIESEDFMNLKRRLGDFCTQNKVELQNLFKDLDSVKGLMK